MMDTFALSIFYYLKAIGKNDFIGGKMLLPATPPFFLLVFILTWIAFETSGGNSTRHVGVNADQFLGLVPPPSYRR
jgi:hypothetical protein